MLGSGRLRRATIAGALTAFLLLEALRVWLPAVLAPATGERVGLEAALAVTAVAALVVAAATTRGPAAVVWIAAVTALAAARVGLAVAHGPWLVAASTLAVGAGAAALVTLAGTLDAEAGRAGRIGVIAGVAATTAVHAATRTAGFVWPRAPLTLVVAVALAALAVALAVWVRPEPGRVPGSGASTPWLLVGPILVLAIAVTGNPGRLTMATGWGPQAVAASVVAVQGAGVLAAVVGDRIGVGRAALAGGVLVLLGTGGAFPASRPSVVAAVLATAVGLGLLAGVEPTTHRGTPQRRRLGAAIGIAVVLAAFAAVALLAGVSLTGGEHLVALALAFLAASVAVTAARRVTPTPGRGDPRRCLGWTTVGVTATVVAAAVAASTPPTWLYDAASDPRDTLFSVDPSQVEADLGEAPDVGGVPPNGSAPPIDPLPGHDDAAVRVATYNVTAGFGLDRRFSPLRQARFLAPTRPDVVVLNEVDRGSLLTGGHDAFLLFAAELDLPEAHFAPAAGLRGNALLSRAPVHELSSRALPGGPRIPRRSELTAVLGLVEGEIAVVGTQLDSTAVAQRLPQARAVAATVAQLHERDLPTVLLGELNAEPDAQELATFAPLLTDPLAPSLATSPSARPELRLHYILLSPQLRGSAVQRPRSDVAGHLPLVLSVTRTDLAPEALP